MELEFADHVVESGGGAVFVKDENVNHSRSCKELLRKPVAYLPVYILGSFGSLNEFLPGAQAAVDLYTLGTRLTGKFLELLGFCKLSHNASCPRDVTVNHDVYVVLVKHSQIRIPFVY